MKNVFSVFFFFIQNFFFSQTLIHHTTNYFGPNANPVPEFTEAAIPSITQFSVTADYYFGHGDQTASSNLKLEIPLLKEKISVKLFATAAEYYKVTDEVSDRRMMQKKEGFATGDLYIQTRIRLLSENSKRPAIIFNSTLKTASGSEFKNRRFFNTAGYYFDVEMGKSFIFPHAFVEEIRLVSDLGFFSWDVQTPNLNVQDDAFMYGLKLILKHKNLSWENTISGYHGWITRVPDYGDQPIVFGSKLNYNSGGKSFFLQYQHGIRYFPFEQIRIGFQLPLEKWTPNFQ